MEYSHGDAALPDLTVVQAAVPAEQTDSAPPTGVRYLVLVLACSISLVLYLHRYTWGFIKAFVKEEFGWNHQTLGWLDSCFTISYAIAQIPSGMICDWFGTHALLGACVILWSLAMGGTALANSLLTMALARLNFGLAQAGCYPILNKVSKNWFPLSMRTTAQGLIATFFGRLGGALSFVLFGGLMLGACGLPWRWAIAIFSALGVCCGTLFLVLFRNTPREHPWANEAEAQLVVADDPQALQATRSRVNWSALAGSVSIWFLFFRAFAANMADVVYVYWVPPYLLEEKQLSLQLSGVLAALPLIGGALGGLCSGWLQTYLLRHTGNRRWARSGVALAGKLLAAALMLLSLLFGDAVVVLCIFLVVKFFSDWEQPAEWGAVSDLAGRNAATVFACVNTVGSLGGVVSSPLIGAILESFKVEGKLTSAGWTTVFVVIAVEYVIAGVCWIFIDCRRSIDTPAVGK